MTALVFMIVPSDPRTNAATTNRACEFWKTRTQAAKMLALRNLALGRGELKLIHRSTRAHIPGLCGAAPGFLQALMALSEIAEARFRYCGLEILWP